MKQYSDAQLADNYLKGDEEAFKTGSRKIRNSKFIPFYAAIWSRVDDLLVISASA